MTAERKPKGRVESARYVRHSDGVRWYASTVISLDGDRPRLVLPERLYTDRGQAEEAVHDALSVSDEQILGFPYG